MTAAPTGRQTPARAILFDVGNTLAHLDYGFLAAQMRPFLGDLDADAVGRADARVRREGWGKSPAGFFQAYVGAICGRLGLEAASAERVAAAAEREHRARPDGLWNQIDPEAAAVLAALTASGVRLGVVSNADGRVEDQLRRFGLRPHFEVVVDSLRAGVAKPDPRIFHLALGRMAVPAAEAVYVGDLLDVDVRGAERAGLRGILYDRWGAWPDAGVPRIARLGELLCGEGGVEAR